MAEDREENANVIPDEMLEAARARIEAEKQWQGRPAMMTPELREEVARKSEEMIRQQNQPEKAEPDQTRIAQAPQPEPEPEPEQPEPEPVAPVFERPTVRPRRSER